MNIMSTIRNPDSLVGQVVTILKNLPKNHTRRQAYDAINAAGLKDGRGKPIVPSVYYHNLCYNVKSNGKTIMQEEAPKFVPVESPYARTNTNPNRGMVVAPANSNMDNDRLGELLVTTSKMLRALIRERNTQKVSPIQTPAVRPRRVA